MNKNEDYKELANNLTDEVVDLRIENEKLKKANKELTEQLRLGVVVWQSEQLFCECAQAKGCDIDEDGHLYCIECQKNIAAK